jgi:hypothetical protein
MAAPPRGKSFHDRRVRDWQEHCAFRQYIHLNPVKKGLPGIAEQYPYSFGQRWDGAGCRTSAAKAVGFGGLKRNAESAAPPKS